MSFPHFTKLPIPTFYHFNFFLSFSHSLKKSHPLSVELVYGNVYCQECNDYVYDTEFEAVSEAFTSRATKSLGHGARYHPWRPTPSEISLLKTHKKRKGMFFTNICSQELSVDYA